MTETLAISADIASRDLVANLALIYLRHGQADRALPLGISAMAMGPPSPALALCVASAFLGCDTPEQAEAVLERFWHEGRLDAPPSETELAAAHSLHAKVLHRKGDLPGAREALRRAAKTAPLDDNGGRP